MENHRAKLRLERIGMEFEGAGGRVVALADVTMEVRENSFVSIVGPSGCGKSTLFSIAAGIIEPSYGEVYLDGKRVERRTEYVSYMLQKDLLLPWRVILDNVILGLEIGGVPKREARERARALFGRYGLQGFENHYPHQLSGGMRQRAALMRTLLLDRPLVLLDEPFGALDALTRSLMQEWLLQIWEGSQRTVVFITHDIEEAIFLSDQIYVMSARPGHMKATVDVDLPRPRSIASHTDARFVALKDHLLHLVREESLRAFEEQGSGALAGA